MLLSTVPAVLVGVLADLWWLSAAIWGFFALLLLADVLLVRRRWRNWGYAELDDDLYITRGVMFRRLTVVPYGRMQVVDVTSGPFERAFGLATVKLVTASASTDATIPGLPPDEAARLRDQLSQRAEARLSGL
nr:PH domain-containing protein [Auraticoccus cholistanensis]